VSHRRIRAATNATAAVKLGGAVVMGRRSYDLGDNEDGYVDYEHQGPIFVVTNRVPEVPAKSDLRRG